MQQRDSDFLIWIAKRLVYKYKENPDIISIIENIIHKYGLEQSTYQDIFFDVHSNLESIISNLVSTNQIFGEKFNHAKEKLEQLELIKTNGIFENLDVEQLFKS
jgi:hypothetical protein